MLRDAAFLYCDVRGIMLHNAVLRCDACCVRLPDVSSIATGAASCWVVRFRMLRDVALK